VSTSEMDVPFGTCDWGGCGELAVARRRYPCCDDELPVCEQHAANRRRASHLQVSQQRLLSDWAVALSAAFLGEVPYQVGSSITGPGWRDVDVRIILADDAHAALVRLLDVDRLNLAVSLWGQIATCLPVDFQIQQVTDASARFDSGPRLALGLR